MTDLILSTMPGLTVCYVAEPLLRAPEAPRGQFASKLNAEAFAQHHANAHGTKYRVSTVVACFTTKIEIVQPQE